MYSLNLVRQCDNVYLDSREVAVILGKSHKQMLRNINSYIAILNRPFGTKTDTNEYFMPSSYVGPRGRTYPCFLLSMLGCDMVATFTDGDKGLLFTALYTKKFGELEATKKADQDMQAETERAEREEELAANNAHLEQQLATLQTTQQAAQQAAPNLYACNSTARIVVRAMQNAGVHSHNIVQFLQGLYRPLGIAVTEEHPAVSAEPTYTATHIAEIHGIYSLAGNPHAQAVSCILNEKIFIGSNHKTIVPIEYTDSKWGGVSTGISLRYDKHALNAVGDWLTDQFYPSEVHGNDRTYRILYDWDFVNP